MNNDQQVTLLMTAITIIQMAYQYYMECIYIMLYYRSLSNTGYSSNLEVRLDPLDLINSDSSDEHFKRLFRVSKRFFLILYEEIDPLYQEKYVRNNKGLGGAPRLPLSIRLGSFLFFIGRDTDYFTSAYMFGINDGSMHTFVAEMANLIVDVFPHVIRLPNSTMEIQELATEWNRFSDLKGIVAAADGCHFPIVLPRGGDSEAFYNFKGWYSILGLFVVDYKCKILIMDLGHCGSLDDSSIIKESVFWNYITQLPDDYYFIGDGGFAIHEKLMIPYNETQLLNNNQNRDALLNFNYQLSRARVRVEQTFGIFKKKWRFLNRAVKVDPTQHVIITHAIAIIHNFSIEYEELNIVSWSSSTAEEEAQEQQDNKYLREWQMLSDFVSQLGPLLVQSDVEIREAGQLKRAEYLSRLIIQRNNE